MGRGAAVGVCVSSEGQAGPEAGLDWHAFSCSRRRPTHSVLFSRVPRPAAPAAAAKHGSPACCRATGWRYWAPPPDSRTWSVGWLHVVGCTEVARQVVAHVRHAAALTNDQGLHTCQRLDRTCVPLAHHAHTTSRHLRTPALGLASLLSPAAHLEVGRCGLEGLAEGIVQARQAGAPCWDALRVAEDRWERAAGDGSLAGCGRRCSPSRCACYCLVDGV